jgi:hypothetical protein
MRRLATLHSSDELGQQFGVLEQMAVAEEIALDVSAPVPPHTLGLRARTPRYPRARAINYGSVEALGIA